MNVKAVAARKVDSWLCERVAAREVKARDPCVGSDGVFVLVRLQWLHERHADSRSTPVRRHRGGA